MPVKFFDPEVTYKPRVSKTSKIAQKKGIKNLTGDIATSSSVSGIELRLLPPLVKENNTRKFLGSGYANLYCLVIVVADVNNQVTGGIDLKDFPRIGDNEHLPIKKNVFYWQKKAVTDVAPTQIHAMCSVVKSKKGLRKAGEIMEEITGSDRYK